MTNDTGPVTLTQLATTAWRGRWATVVGCAVGLLVGVVVHVTIPQTYSATATVRVAPLWVDPLSPDQAVVDMRTEERLAGSRRIASTADVTAEAIEDSTVLRITATSRTARRAAHEADVVARAYLADRASIAASGLAQLRSLLREQLDELDPRHDRAEIDQLSTDLARSRRLRTAGGELLDTARPPDAGDVPALPVTMLAGVLLGLLASLPIAVGMGRGRVAPSAHEVSQIGGSAAHRPT